MGRTRKITLGILGIIAIALIVGALWKAPYTFAANNPFATFWSDLTHPFAKNSGAGVVAAAGIKSEDIIESVNGLKLDSTHDLANVINEYAVGNTVTLVVNRTGKEVTLQATLAQRPAGE